MLLLALVAWLTAVAVQPGELGSIDTKRRLQTTHSFWTAEPAVAPGDYPKFGLVGRNNAIYPWYGIGQVLAMLPSDVVGSTLASKLARPADHDEFREVFITYTISPLLAVGTILLAFRFLVLLEFSVNQAVAGALALLFGTTFLHYAQNMMENNLMMLLTLGGFCWQYEWRRTGRQRALLFGSLALSANLLVRLTTGLNVIAAAMFITLCIIIAQNRAEAFAMLKRYAATFIPCFLVFIAADRAYHFYRFNACCNTYIDIYATQTKLLDPTLPANFPYTTPFWTGFWGPLITLEKSMFLYDPLLILLAIVTIMAWKRLGAAMRAYLVSTALMLLAYIAFHARFDFWSGGAAWGDRYISIPVQLLGFMAVPLMLRHGAEMGAVLRKTGAAIVAAAVGVQFLSITVWHPLEIEQMQSMGKPVFIIGLRLVNTVAIVLGKMDAWHLTNQYTKDYGTFHAKTLYFYPFIISQRHHLPSWFSAAVVAAWIGLIAVMLWVLYQIRKQARLGWKTQAESSLALRVNPKISTLEHRQEQA
jgi:hypothetical protein